MRKNRMMRLASALLILTMVTTCAISGTFAKYVTSDSATDSARVAKWGIDVTVGGNLFGQFYDAVSDSNSDSIVASSTNVASNGGDNIIAPGTKNFSGFQVKVTGQPEVAYNVTAKTGKTITGAEANEDIFLAAGDWGTMVAVDGLNDATDVSKYYTLSGTTFTQATAPYDAGTQYYELHDTVTVATGGYYPINWGVTTTGDELQAIGTTSDLTAIAADMVTKFNALNDADSAKTYSNANDVADACYTLTWEWPFESGHDGEDTILGNLQAADTTNIVVKKSGDNYTSDLTDGTDYNLDVKFAFEVTVTQVN